MIQFTTQPLPGLAPATRAAGFPFATTSDFALALAGLAGPPAGVASPAGAPVLNAAVLITSGTVAPATVEPAPTDASVVAIALPFAADPAPESLPLVATPLPVAKRPALAACGTILPETAAPQKPTDCLVAPVPLDLPAMPDVRATPLAEADDTDATPDGDTTDLPAETSRDDTNAALPAPPPSPEAPMVAPTPIIVPVAVSVPKTAEVRASTRGSAVVSIDPVSTPQPTTAAAAPVPAPNESLSRAAANARAAKPVVPNASDLRLVLPAIPQPATPVSIGRHAAPLQAAVAIATDAPAIEVPVPVIPAAVGIAPSQLEPMPAGQLTGQAERFAPPPIAGSAVPVTKPSIAWSAVQIITPSIAGFAVPVAATPIAAALTPVSVTASIRSQPEVTVPPLAERMVAPTPAAQIRPHTTTASVAEALPPVSQRLDQAFAPIQPVVAPPRFDAPPVGFTTIAQPAPAAATSATVVAPPIGTAIPQAPVVATKPADAPAVTVTVAGPAVAPPPVVPPTPQLQPAAQAFAAAMFAASAPVAAALPGEDEIVPLTLAATVPVATSAPTIAVAAPVQGQAPALDLAKDDWMATMIDRIETLRDDSGGIRETRMKLLPEALGGVEVSVRRDETGAIQVRIAADTAQARALLTEAAPKLAEMAEARGLKLGGSSVDAGAGDPRRDTPAPPPAAVARRPASARPDPMTDAPDDARLA